MSAVLKSLLVSCAVLSMAALSFADEPTKSVLDGGRPLAPPVDDTLPQDGSCSSCSEDCDSVSGCSSDCQHGWCLKSSGLFQCSKDSCKSSCSHDCGNNCGKYHGCWLHQSGNLSGNAGCNDGGSAFGSGCDSCGNGKQGHGHGKHSKCGRGCHGDGYHQGRFYTRCNLIPHIAYINPLSSYYYFRPYQAFHVRAQQDEVVTYGGDPRNPYANLVFDNLYAELEAGWAEAEAEMQDLGSPFEDEVPQREEDEAEQPATPAVDPPAPNYSTSHSPAIRLRSVRQAKPIEQSTVKQQSTASSDNSQRSVFRVKK